MTLIDLCCVLDTMLIKMLFIQRTKTTHTLQQQNIFSLSFSFGDNKNKQIFSCIERTSVRVFTLFTQDELHVLFLIFNFTLNIKHSWKK